MKTQSIGTIIASILTYEQLNATIEEGAICTKDSTYAPCDGRVISEESALGELLRNTVGHLNVPDLRGKFLRGLNQMDPLNQPQQPFDYQNYGDPDGMRNAGDYQADAIVEHTHGYKIGNFQNNADAGTKRSYVGADYNQNLTSGGVSVNNKNTYETRPRNVAVFYYIKIN